MSQPHEQTLAAWLRLILLAVVVGLAVSFLSGCDEDDEPYIDPDSRGCCRCIGDDCPDGGVDDDGGGQ